MISITVAVNNNLIELIQIVELESLDTDPYEGEYRYEVSTCGKRMEVIHKRSEGWEVLVGKILKRLQRSDKVDYSGE